MEENKMHYVNIKIPELYLERYTEVLCRQCENSNIRKTDSDALEELSIIFCNFLRDIEK